MEYRRHWKQPYRRSEEFHEEDIWNIINDNDEKPALEFDNPNTLPTPPRPISRRLPSAARMIQPSTNKHERNYDTVEPQQLLLQQQSAPVNVPDWHKIYGKNPINADNSSSISTHTVNVRDAEDDSDVEDDDDDDDERLPPHEWVARKLARSRISSFSVCEGAGRTLKGRDLSRVRNAVLSKTGFI